MSYEEFVNQYTAGLKKAMEEQGEDIEVVRHAMAKVNGTEDALVIQYRDYPVAPIIYIADNYRQYQAGKTLDDLVKKTVGMLVDIKQERPKIPELTAASAKANLYLSIINADKNRELLKDVPHERLHDLAVISRYRLDDQSSFIVNNNLCGSLRMTSEEILETARVNTLRRGFECESMESVIRKMLKESGYPRDYVDDMAMTRDGKSVMYVLSNKEKMDGAIVMALKESMQEVYTKINEGFYVLPSSRHEVLVVPDSAGMSSEELAVMVKEVNQSVVEDRDILSDNVYHFNGKILGIANRMEQVQTQEKVMTHLKNHRKR